MRVIFLAALAISCKNGGDDVPVPPGPTTPSPLLQVTETESYSVPGLSAPAYAIYTDEGVPHLYAANRVDLYRIQGFTVARDRFFSMDLVRRLSTGRVSELLGDVGLESDLESRGIGMTHVTDTLLAALTDAQQVQYQAYADGFNDYIAAVQRGEQPVPSEFEFAGPLIGVADPIDLMEPWTLRDVAAIGGTIAYRLGFETGDINRSRDFALLDGLFAGAPLETLRQEGLMEFWSDVTPVFDRPSAPGFGSHGTTRSAGRPHAVRPAPIERTLANRAVAKADRVQNRFGRDHEEGWGSNAWAVSGAASADGRALLAGDGHLELDIPALMYRIGLDTEHLGGGDTHMVGTLLVGMPVLAVGTNGQVAWSSTQHSGDVTDWYAETVQLDANGAPAATFFQGEWQDVVSIDETYTIADIPLLGSTGRTETVRRFTTFDGRWLFDIEGRDAAMGDPVEAGESLLNIGGSWVIPGDMDGDGVISAISFDFTGLDRGNLFALFDDMAHASNVREFHEATRQAQALSQNLVAADSAGDIFYTGYEMVPCRGYLPRNGDGTFVDGADPTMLLDGSTYGAFEMRTLPDFTADTTSSDPYHCIIPFDEYPHSFTPEVGFLATANQDPGGIESDGERFNDAWHIGGPWDDGYRAEAIDRQLTEHIAAGTADLEAMGEVQGYHVSSVGRHHLQHFLDAIDHARTVDTPEAGSSEERLATLYAAQPTRFDEVFERLSAWGSRGHEAASGVETFYSGPVDEDTRADAIATMIFNVWLGDLIRHTLDDEGFPGRVYQGGGSAGRLRILDRLLNGRGPNNPRDLASFNPDTEESAFWDVLSTPEIEESDEVLMLALTDALAFLESPTENDYEGGFGTPDMEMWLWGMRHQVEFSSLVGQYVDDPLLGPLFDQFSVTTEVLPLDDGLTNDDPRSDLKWFPRPGDNRCIDAANPGLSGRRFRHGNGPVMRMAFALGENGVEGFNIIPGGQSGIVDTEHYADQTGKWLANEASPVRFTVDEVVPAAVRRVTFTPASE